MILILNVETRKADGTPDTTRHTIVVVVVIFVVCVACACVTTYYLL